MLPFDALALVFFLLLFQDNLDEQLLQLFVAVVDAELFEAANKQEHSSMQSTIISNEFWHISNSTASINYMLQH